MIHNNNINIAAIIELRKQLHMYAELAFNENKTKELICDFLRTNAPSFKIINIAETGIAAVYDSGNIGATIMFRADMDALPIAESLSIPYASCNKNISHKCGHDGHSAILCGLANYLEKEKLPNGKVILIFQPAEETGEGAKQIIEDAFFKTNSPEYIFALHNLPGFEKNSIIIKKHQFASASKGMIVKLTGKVAHAAYPENGVSPAIAMAELIQQLHNIPLENELFDNFILLTIIHASLGEKAFGTAPAYAEIMATLRSFDDTNMKRLVHECLLVSKEIAQQHGLNISIDWTDEFDETFNNADAVDIIEKAAKKNNSSIIHATSPFRWSEDFGVFTQKYKGAIFSIGAGISHPALHTKEYDFPDDIIETGVNLFADICKTVLTETENNLYDRDRHYRYSGRRQGDDS